MHIFKKFKSILLTKLIKQERKKVSRFAPKDFFKLLFSEVYIPSPKSFFLVLLFLLFFFVLARVWKIASLSQDSNHYQNLIAIHAGIGTIIFALIIFIAESLRDDEAKDKARVLLKESYLFPIAVAEILVFFVFIWGDANLWSIIPVGAIGLLTIWSLSRLIKVLLSKYRFAQKRAELLKERLQQSIDLAIDERIGNNILFSKLNAKEIKLEFLPFTIGSQSDYYCFEAEKSGIVSDIDLQTLREIADIIDSEARDNGFSFVEEQKPEVRVGKEGAVLASESRTLIQNNRRYLMKKFHDVMDEKNRTLICVDKKIIKKKRELEKLNSLVRNSFTIKSADNFAEEVRYEISGVKDQFITAIETKQLGKIEELISLYIKLAEGFLEHITKWGGGYSSEQARKERHSLFAGWDQVRWLSSDIRDLFELAMRSHDREIIRKVAYLPIAIARRSIEKNDHYLFQEFIWFPDFLYMFALREKDADLRDFMIDRSWRYLKEISDVYVEGQLTNAISAKKDLQSLKDFSIYFFIIFQNLLKRSFDNKDFESFEKFKIATQKLIDSFKPSESTENVENIRWQIVNAKLTSEQRSELEDLLTRQLPLENAETEIRTRRCQMFFGLASWILDNFLRNKEDEKIKQFYDSIQVVHPSTLEEFTDIFLKTHSFDVEDFWGWNWWEMIIEGEVHSVQILEKLERFYAVKALSLLADKTNVQIDGIHLPHSRDLAYLAEGSRDLIKILDDVKANPENWKFILTDNAISKVDALKSLLSRAKEAQEQEELRIKRESNISQNKVQEFKNGVLRGFYESVILRDVFRFYGLLEKQLNESVKDVKARFGINKVDDKAAFFEDWYVHFGEWGNNYGHDLAAGENYYLLDEVAKDCQEISREGFEATLSKFDKPEDIIIFATNVALWRFFDDSKNFKPKWHRDIKQLDVKGFGGWYDFQGQLIPIFDTYHREIKKQILILNKNKLGRLIQLSPLNEGEDENLIKDIFYLNVQAFSENDELMNQFIKKPPEWLKKIGNEQRQREYLQGLVLIKIFERFDYNKSKDFDGYKLRLKA